VDEQADPEEGAEKEQLRIARQRESAAEERGSRERERSGRAGEHAGSTERESAWDGAC
jgi:hypothetical protein